MATGGGARPALEVARVLQPVPTSGWPAGAGGSGTLPGFRVSLSWLALCLLWRITKNPGVRKQRNSRSGSDGPVTLDDSAPDLKTWLGDIVSIATGFDDTSGMNFDGDVIKPAAANWKTYGDNSCEGYHVGMVHWVRRCCESRSK
jgi:hypothetical protein